MAARHQIGSDVFSISSSNAPPRVAVVGAGFAGLSCARELMLSGCDPVVFEAQDRLGGRCSSRRTRVGLFDDGAQCIHEPSRLPAYAAQRAGELAALHSWTVAATPAEVHREAKDRGEDDDDEEDGTVILRSVGAVGVPSMSALAEALARPLDVRLNTPILQARRRSAGWTLRGPTGEIDEEFQALVLAVPAPLAIGLARDSSALAYALGAVRYRSRWVLLLGSVRPVALPGYREFHGSPIERVAAMHSKPGRLANAPQRWFVEADERWSLQHQHDDAEAVADLLLENFRAHAGRSVTPNYLRAHQWRHAFVETPAATPMQSACLWDDKVRLGVCGDSVVASRVDRVHFSGVAMSRAVTEGLTSCRENNGASKFVRSHIRQLEPQL